MLDRRKRVFGRGECDLRCISTDVHALVGARKGTGYALVDFALVSLRLQSSSLNVEITSPHSKPTHRACELDFPRRHDLIQLLEDLISRDAVVVNARCADVTGVSATAARFRELAGFFACNLGVESSNKLDICQSDIRGLSGLPSIPIFSWDHDDAAVLFADDYAVVNQHPCVAKRGL
jgi:hypothetical protein